MPGANLCLSFFNFLDPQHTKKAESELLNTFNKMGFIFHHQKYKELLIVSKKEIKTVTDQFTNVSNKYLGHVKELLDEIKNYQNQILLIKKDHQLELSQKNLELIQKNQEIFKLNSENQLLKKDIEILSLKKKYK